ncbi:uncharacterized protein LOC128228804 [Mya arenaria]|uniref:uncharacterized protein LOC128228804 n=1 Tax=Mya arenaria TaxID=6604 RepID=UPI0022E5D866|nr:uncharacterized protein LOC128228804 [Mya arenaria]
MWNISNTKTWKRPLSQRLCSVLCEIGVNKRMIQKRRQTFLLRETLYTIDDNTDGKSSPKGASKVYVFGSQSEGTTTPDMRSDVDTMSVAINIPVVMSQTECADSKQRYLFTLDQDSPPQHCRLQPIGSDTEADELHIVREIGPNDRRFISNKIFEKQLRKRIYGSEKWERHGPSITPHPRYDCVHAFPCATIPEDCVTWLCRPRPGHWPLRWTRERARKSGIFLLTSGHPESYFPEVEWRYSTSLVERYLMFDCNTIQLRAFLVLKMMRKTFFKPVLGDRLSTFHFKTALFFTIETYPPEVWKEHRLVECLECCLTTLLRWLQKGYCPHYTIAGVDLFVGKIHKQEMKQLIQIIENILSNNLQCLTSIRFDNVGLRLANKMSILPTQYKHVHVPFKSQENCMRAVSDEIFDEMAFSLYSSLFVFIAGVMKLPYHGTVQAVFKKIQKLDWFRNSGNEIQRKAAEMFLPHFCSLLASLTASFCCCFAVDLQPLTLLMYMIAEHGDVAAAKLKFASMLYQRKDYQLASCVLISVSMNMGKHVWLACKEHRRTTKAKSKDCNTLLLSKDLNYSMRHAQAKCVEFMRHEIHCVPKHFAYEMYRAASREEIEMREPLVDDWMDMAVVDSLPYLYYLQYLTFKKLNVSTRVDQARSKLINYVAQYNGYGHLETALNLLGHFFEMENNHWLAYVMYCKSLQAQRKNNAANWHIMRLIYSRTLKHI